jgi:hypothetical protein
MEISTRLPKLHGVACYLVYQKRTDLHFSAGMMATKMLFCTLRNIYYKGWFVNTVWEDKWLVHTTLRERYLGLYNIVRHKVDPIVPVMETSPR